MSVQFLFFVLAFDDFRFSSSISFHARAIVQNECAAYGNVRVANEIQIF